MNKHRPSTTLPDSPPGLLAALGGALPGPGQVRSRAVDRLALGHDASHFALTPSAVATPKTPTRWGGGSPSRPPNECR